MNRELTKTEREILEECDGRKPPRPWGAHVGACYEVLESLGYLRRGRITDKGREYLADSETK